MDEESLGVDESTLTTVSLLGQGSFGCVTLERDSNSRLCAKKSLPMPLRKILEKELRIMHRFRNHPRIVQASNALHLEIKPHVCFIYMEYASQGNLHKMICGFSRKSQPVPEHLIQRAARMILEGLEALHAQGYVHGDLKPLNILLFPSTTFGEPWDLKLADFGSSKEPNSDHDSMSTAGTAPYMSPESFGPNGLIDQALDIHSLGCVVYEMLGALPLQEVFDEYYEWKLCGKISPEVGDFLRRCNDMHPRRATAAELLNHPFITQRLPPPTTEDNKELGR